MRIVFALFLSALCGLSYAQVFRLSGQLNDGSNNSPLPGVNVIVAQLPDSTKWVGTVTDMDGRFAVELKQKGKYLVKATFIGFEPLRQVVNVDKDKTWLGIVNMSSSSQTLEDVVIQADRAPAEQKGDTMQFNASEYKTEKNATTEDLVTKMPGVTIEDGVLKVNGEQITKILVDGKPFFGDDPTMALKNLPADLIRKIQVYDKMSDQAKFTGFDDGNSERTINLITKKDMGYGMFGNFTASGGTDERYNLGGNYNLFKGDQRISILFMSNNINQQNFSNQDLAGIKGPNNFMVGGQGGLVATDAIGLNYSDTWGKNKKVKVTGSYFFNYTDANSINSLERTYLLASQGGLVYNENSENWRTNFNHRFNYRMEYTIDSFNTIIWTPAASLQTNGSATDLTGINDLPGNIIQSTTNNHTTWNNNSYSLWQNLLYQHAFEKKGRTISMNVSNGGWNQRSINGLNSTTTTAPNDSTSAQTDTTVLNQRTNQHNIGYWVNANISYTEPIGKVSMLQFNYNPSYNKNLTDRETSNIDSVTQEYTLLDTANSNKFDANYVVHRIGTAYRLNIEEKVNFMVGVNYQYATLTGQEVYPGENTVNRQFLGILPQMTLNYKFSKTRNLKVYYNANSNFPNIWQLQNVVNNSNPLFLSSGNPNLREDYEQGVTVRYESSKPDKGTNMSVYLNGNYYMNYMGNLTVMPTNDTALSNGVQVKGGGGQYTMPVNLSGYWNARSNVTFGKLISEIKCNLNFSSGVSVSQTPGQINSAINNSDNYAFTQNISLSSNISEKIDFTVSYRANYNIVVNSLQEQSNFNYFSQSAFAKFNWMFWQGFVFNSTLNHYFYYGLSQNYNQSVFLWNLSLGYRFFKDQSLELKGGAYDVLNQNSNINRTVNVTYIQDSRTNVLPRYFMFTLSYTLKKFKIPPQMQQAS